MVRAKCVVTCLVDGKIHRAEKEYQFPDGWKEPESKIGRKKFEVLSGGSLAGGSPAAVKAPAAEPGKASGENTPLFDKNKGR